MIYTFQPTKYYHIYRPNPAALHVNPGDTIITSTVDAGGLIIRGTRYQRRQDREIRIRFIVAPIL